MANVGTAAAGKTLIGAGNGASPTFADIGTNSGLTSHGVVISQGNSAFVASNAGTNGQVLIGSTGANPAFATLTSFGGTITFIVGANSLNLESTSGVFTWTDTSGTFSALKNNGYFITGTATANLPAVPSQGNEIKFIVDHASQALTIQSSGTQVIRFGNSVSSAAGTFVSTARGDSVTLVYRASDTAWIAESFVGTWTFT